MALPCIKNQVIIVLVTLLIFSFDQIPPTQARTPLPFINNMAKASAKYLKSLKQHASSTSKMVN